MQESMSWLASHCIIAVLHFALMKSLTMATSKSITDRIPNYVCTFLPCRDLISRSADDLVRMAVSCLLDDNPSNAVMWLHSLVHGWSSTSGHQRMESLDSVADIVLFRYVWSTSLGGLVPADHWSRPVWDRHHPAFQQRHCSSERRTVWWRLGVFRTEQHEALSWTCGYSVCWLTFVTLTQLWCLPQNVAHYKVYFCGSRVGGILVER